MINKILTWLEKLLTPSPNDWKLVEVMHGEWDVEYRDRFAEKVKYTETSVYEIYYSSSKNEYKLEVSGYKPKEHYQYTTAAKRANELQNELNK